MKKKIIKKIILLKLFYVGNTLFHCYLLKLPDVNIERADNIHNLNCLHVIEFDWSTIRAKTPKQWIFIGPWEPPKNTRELSIIEETENRWFNPSNAHIFSAGIKRVIFRRSRVTQNIILLSMEFTCEIHVNNDVNMLRLLDVYFN